MILNTRPYRIINRKKTKTIMVGNVAIGGNNPISVQSMTNTLTTDITKTINQINNIVDAGADLVRVSCPDKESTLALKTITKNVSVNSIPKAPVLFSSSLRKMGSLSSFL